MSASIKWTERNGDAASPDGFYTIEQAGESVWWAFAGERPLGTYRSMAEAKERCERHAADHSGETA